jgi:hypothetical protein
VQLDSELIVCCSRRVEAFCIGVLRRCIYYYTRGYTRDDGSKLLEKPADAFAVQQYHRRHCMHLNASVHPAIWALIFLSSAVRSKRQPRSVRFLRLPSW